MGVAQALASSVAGTYLSLLLIGAMTLASEWNRIHGTAGQKWKALFAFPVYMLSFVPIIVSSLFRKFHWPPITHTAAISAESLSKEE